MENDAIQITDVRDRSGAMEFSPPSPQWDSRRVLAAIDHILGSTLTFFFQSMPERRKKGHSSMTTSMMYNHCDRPGSTCLSCPNCNGRSHCWPRTKGGLWLWRLPGICTIAGAKSPFFLLVLRHRAGGVLPAPHTTGLSHSRLQARAEQCQSTSTKHTHTHRGRKRESHVLLDDSLSISIK